MKKVSGYPVIGTFCLYILFPCILGLLFWAILSLGLADKDIAKRNAERDKFASQLMSIDAETNTVLTVVAVLKEEGGVSIVRVSGPTKWGPDLYAVSLSPVATNDRVKLVTVAHPFSILTLDGSIKRTATLAIPSE